MHWKNDYIGEETAVPEYIERHLAALGIDARICIEKNLDSNFKIFRGFTPDDEKILWLTLYNEDDELSIDNLKIYEPDDLRVKGRGIGSLLLKCALAIAFDLQKTSIKISSVGKDGFSFWPYHATLPLNNQITSGHFTKFFDFYADQISDKVYHDLKALSTLSEKDSFQAWRSLSQYEGRLLTTRDNPGRPVQQIIFQSISSQDDHILVPGEPNTRAILEKRLGQIPPFRAPSSAYLKGVCPELLRHYAIA